MENSERYRDEYTKILQEQAFAYEDRLQLEKDDNALVRAFNDLTTNANALNTPEKALNYMLANNAGFRKGKLSRKSQKAINQRKGGEVKFSEKNINDLAVKYKAGELDADETMSFFDQYRNTALAAMGFDTRKGDIPTDKALGFATDAFGRVTRTYKPKDGSFTNWIYSTIGREGRAKIGQEIERKKVTSRISEAQEQTRLKAEETAEAGIELEERAAREKKAERKKIDPRKLTNVAPKIKAIEEAVDFKPSDAPTASFRSISDRFGRKVSSIIYDVKEDKLGKDAKNLTYADQIVDPKTGKKAAKGIVQKSEIGQIQQDFKNASDVRTALKLLPPFNIVTPETEATEQGEILPTSRDLSGTSIALSNKILDFFYEDFIDPNLEITNKSGRSKGLTSQVKVKALKPEFKGTVSNETVKKVQDEFAFLNTDFAAIKDSKARLKAIREAGQNLKGWANLKGGIVANTIVDQRIKDTDLKTAKPKKQIRADVRGGRSQVQFSERLAKDMREVAEKARLLESPVYRSTIKELNARGFVTIADIKNSLGLPVKEADKTKNIKKSGFRVLAGELDLIGGILNEFIKDNPKYYATIKSALTGSLSRSLFGATGTFYSRIDAPEQRTFPLSRQLYKANERLSKNFVKLTEDQNFIEDQYAKLEYFKNFWKDVETFLNKKNKDGSDNRHFAWVFQEFNVDAVNNMGHLNRVSPPILYLPINSDGSIDFNSDIREEHNFPSNNVGNLMLWGAMNNQIDNVMKVISAAYMQGPILMTDDKRIDATSIDGQFDKEKYKFSKKFSGGLSVNMPNFFWDKVVPRILSGDLVIPEGLAAVIRLTAANVNLDSYKFLPENMTMSEYLFGTNGVPTETKIKGVPTQNQIAQEFFSGEITLQEARQKGKDAVATLNKLNQTIKPEAPTELEFGNKADKAMANARNSVKYSERIRKARVFDFDDTLARSKSQVIVNMPNPEGGFSEGTTKLKAIFMVGGPGAGKTNVGKGLQLGRRGYKVVNQDIALEAMKEEAGLPAKESDYTAEQRSLRSKLGAAARKAAVAKFDKYTANGDGMVVDGTGASYNATMKKVKQLEDAGYEVHMVVATTPLETALERNKARKERSLADFIVKKTYEQVQESLAKYRVDFGNRLYEINTETIEYGKPLPNEFLQVVYAGITSNKVFKINATEFARDAGNLEQQGATFNFSEFSKVIDGEKGPLFETAKFISEAPGQRDMFVLTARPADSATAIKAFLDGLDLNIPIENIIGLGDGKPEAKANWFVEKYGEGYNDFYFADDALKNVKAVKDVFNVLDVKSKVQQARVKFSERLSKDFNDMIERNKGVKSEAKFSDIQARRRGRNQKRFSFFIPPSADDFRGLTQYTFAGKGKQGEADQEFFDKALIKPYLRGVAAMNKARTQVRTDYRALISNNKPIRKKLKKKVQDSNYTHDEAIRVYLWTNENYEIPGMSKRDQKMLFDFVNADPDLKAFAEGVKIITRKDQYLEPTEYWDGSTILGDLNGITTETNRAEYLKEFIDNSKIIFSKDNLNKIEAVYGFRVRESIENALYRMETGQNKNKGAGRIVNAWNNWVNNSVGTIMFFNRRSALLQTLSSVNFVNWSDNNPIKAGIAFANQPQYWKDFITLFNSPTLVARRKGLQGDLQEAEIAEAAKKGGAKGVISYILKIGFTPTQIADSFAIASGGATFYRNRINTYLKEGLTQENAEKKAFEDFVAISEETQQSADPMFISQQQASVLGRLVLAFQNTPMQYTRLIKKAGQDLINGRGNPMTNMSKIIYYGFVQNLIFSTLQNAMFALLPGFDDEEEDFESQKERDEYFEKKQKQEEKKITRTINSMIDTLLRGSGLGGAVISTIKNTIMAYQTEMEKDKFDRENANILLSLASISPPIGSKLRKINSALRTKEFEEDVIAERGFDVTIDGKFQLSPTYQILGQTASAAVNLPLDRAVDELNAITEALDTRNTMYQRIALGLGWRQWDVGARVEEHDLIKTAAKEKRKEEGKAKAKATRLKNKQIFAEQVVERNRIYRILTSEGRRVVDSIERKTGKLIAPFKIKQILEDEQGRQEETSVQ